MQAAASPSSRSLKEKMSAASADPVQRAVIKATDSEVQAPKAKHVDRLLAYTFRVDVPAHDLLVALQHRLDEPSWVVVLKTLTVFHRLMRDGNEKFFQHLATQSSVFRLESFVDKKSPDGISMTGFIHKYAAYLSAKLLSFRLLGFDLCHVKAAKHTQYLATEAPPPLFASVRMLQNLLEALLDTLSQGSAEPKAAEVGRGSHKIQVTPEQILANDTIKAAVSLLFKDALKFFVALNTAIVNLLERFFTLQMQPALEALSLYEHFTKQCQGIDRFISACQNSGVLEGKHIPDLSQAPAALLPTMRTHVQTYGQRKGDGAPPPAAAAVSAEYSLALIAPVFAHDESISSPVAPEFLEPEDDEELQQSRPILRLQPAHARSDPVAGDGAPLSPRDDDSLAAADELEPQSEA